MFVVREGNGRQADNHSIGGVTKLIEECIMTIYTPILEIKKGKEEPQSSLYQIYKEDISLKELDYRLRKQSKVTACIQKVLNKVKLQLQ